MSYKQMTGNIISATKVEPDGSFKDSAASGVWSLQEAFDYTKASNWPSQSNGATPVGFFAGKLSAGSNFIHKIIITTLGNATDVGDLTVERYLGSGVGSTTRGLFAGGLAVGARSTVVDYITFASAGDATDFGNL